MVTNSSTLLLHFYPNSICIFIFVSIAGLVSLQISKEKINLSTLALERNKKKAKKNELVETQKTVSCVRALINKGGAAVAFAAACDCLQVPATGYVLNHEPAWKQLEDVCSYFDFVLTGWMTTVMHLVF